MLHVLEQTPCRESFFVLSLNMLKRNDGSHSWWRLIKNNRYVPHTNWVLFSGYAGDWLFSRIDTKPSPFYGYMFCRSTGIFNNAHLSHVAVSRWRNAHGWNNGSISAFDWCLCRRSFCDRIPTQFMNRLGFVWIAKSVEVNLIAFTINWFEPKGVLRSWQMQD